MKPKYAYISLCVILTLVVAFVASSLAQENERSRKDSSVTILPGDLAPPPPSIPPLKEPESKPTTDGFYNPHSSLKTTGPLPRKISDEEAALIRKFGAEEAQLVSQTDDLIRQLETAESAPQLVDAEAKLSDHLGKWFDVRQKRQEREIEALEAQVKTLKELARKRQENREEIISRKLDQLVRDSQGLGF